MTDSPLISICIPAYKRLSYLQRLLDSICVQNCSNFEVIITDDSPDHEIESHIKETAYSFPVRYFRNAEPKGTPLNWMEGIRYARGEWIKIIHDDDWFSGETSLQVFQESTTKEVDCIFSGYMAHYEFTGKEIDKTISHNRFKRLNNHPYYLFASNELGPPSVVMFRKSMRELYDPGLKWLVDIEAYVRMLSRYRCMYIARPLITMSYNDTQVTNECFRNPEIELKEALIYYKKNGPVTYRRLMTYDAWWRLIRNLQIRKKDQLQLYSGGEIIPDFLKRILSYQRLFPIGFLNIGALSKFIMFFFYIVNYSRGFRHHH